MCGIMINISRFLPAWGLGAQGRLEGGGPGAQLSGQSGPGHSIASGLCNLDMSRFLASASVSFAIAP